MNLAMSRGRASTNQTFFAFEVIPRVVVFVNDPLSTERRIDLLSFLLFYGLMVEKYALICAMEIQKILWLFISSQDLLYLRN